MSEAIIRNISLDEDLSPYSDLLNMAFLTVAKEFNLTKENCPTNNAFITPDALRNQINSRCYFYGCFLENELIGFIAIEKSKTADEVYYIEKLAVRPNYRCRGIGKLLMEHASLKIKEKGGRIISIGIINSNQKLKN